MSLLDAIERKNKGLSKDHYTERKTSYTGKPGNVITSTTPNEQTGNKASYAKKTQTNASGTSKVYVPDFSFRRAIDKLKSIYPKRETEQELKANYNYLTDKHWSGDIGGYDKNKNNKLDLEEVESYPDFISQIALKGIAQPVKLAAKAAKSGLINFGRNTSYAGAAVLDNAAANIKRNLSPPDFSEAQTFADAAKILKSEYSPNSNKEERSKYFYNAVQNTWGAMADKANNDAREYAKNAYGTFGVFSNDLLTSITQMAPSIALAVATQGGSAPTSLAGHGGTIAKAAEILKIPTHMIPTFTQLMGQSYDKSISDGVDTDKALRFALIDAYAGTLIEKGGVQENISKGMANTGIRNFLKENVLGEGLEEVSQNATSATLRKISGLNDAPVFSMTDDDAVINPKRDAYSFAMGGLSGGLFGAVTGGLSGNKNNSQASIENDNTVNQKSENSEIDNANIYYSVKGTQSEGKVAQNVGRVTKIYNPYSGKVPVQVKKETATQNIAEQFVSTAKRVVEQAINPETNTVSRSAVRTEYERLFDLKGGQKNIEVNGMTIDGEPYVVTVNKSAVRKVISDPHFSVEKLAVLSDIENVIENGEYVGSGTYEQKGKEKDTVRFDYFETPVTINGKEYIAAFDVEVFPGANNYRTHKVIEKMDVIPISVTVADPVPAAAEHAPTSRAIGVESSPSDISIPLNSENSNKNILSEGKKGQEAAFKLMDVLTDRYGAIFRTYSGDSRRNGFFDPKSGVIYINESSDAPMVDTVSHEFLHFFKQIDIEGYELLKRQVDKDLDAERFLEYKKDLLGVYDELGIDYSQMSESKINDMVREEAMSDLMAEVMRNPNTIERIALENRTLAEKIIDCLRKMVDEIKAAFSSMGDVADPEVRALVKNFDLISEIYQEVIVGSAGSFEGRAITANEKTINSVRKDNKGGSYWQVDADKDIFSDIEDRKELKKAAYNYILKGDKGEIINEIIDGKPLQFTRISAQEYVYGSNGKTLGEQEYDEKMRMAPSISDLIENASVEYDTPDHKNHKFAKDGFKNYRGRVGIGDTIFTYIVRVGKADGRNMFYDINLEVESATLPSAKARQRYKMDSTSNNSIPQENTTVNNNIRNNGLNDATKIQNSVVRRRDKAQEAIDKYKESGDVRDLPPNSWASGYARDAKGKVIHIENQLAEAQYNAKYNTETQEDNAALTELIKKLEQKHDEALKELGVAEDLRDTIKSATLRDLGLSEIAGELHDIDGWKTVVKNGNYDYNDVYRNFKRVFGKYFKQYAEPVLDAFDSAKGDASRDLISRRVETHTKIVKELGIEKGSIDSKRVQWIAEGERNANWDRDKAMLKAQGITNWWQFNKLKKGMRVSYTEEMLIAEVGEKRAAQIKGAAEWFRKQYDELVDEINRTIKAIYPNSPEKLIAKRKDYMRHFREIKSGFGGLKTIFEMDNNIDPKLVGTSEYTQPKSKFASIKQVREGAITDEGAIEGFLDYLPQAMQAIYIDPYINRFRSMAKELAEIKSAVGETNLNAFIGFLQDFSNNLAGKTSALDRVLTKNSMGRTVLKALSWLNNRTKANAVLGNLGSVTKQVMNIPNGLALLENPANMVGGLLDTLYGCGLIDKAGARRGENEIHKNYELSDFLTERLAAEKSERLFEKNGLTKGAQWLLGAADEFGTRTIWNAAYREGLKIEGKDNPKAAARYADKLTRSAVGGRGVGEVPLAYRSQLGRLALPFQIEVGNTWNVYRDVLTENRKQGKLQNAGDKALRLALMAIAGFGLNEVLEKLTGSRGAFDIINDIWDGITQGLEEEKDEGTGRKLYKSALRSGQNVAGDFIGSRAFGWATSELMSWCNEDWASDWFNDSIYSSQGVNVPAVQSASKAVRKYVDGNWIGGTTELATSFITPFGGKQIDKTIRGISDVARGGSYKNDIYKEKSTGERGDMYYEIEKTPAKYAQAALFGPSSLSENKEYWGGKRLATLEKEKAKKLESEQSRAFRKEYDRQNPNGEVKRLYNEVKSFEVYPFEQIAVGRKFTFKKQKYTFNLSKKEQERYQQLQNNLMKEKYSEVIKSSEYKKASTAEKTELLKETRSAAKSEVSEQIVNDYKKKNNIR